MAKHKIITFESCCPSPIKFCKILDVSDINFTEVKNLTEKIGPNRVLKEEQPQLCPFSLEEKTIYN